MKAVTAILALAMAACASSPAVPPGAPPATEEAAKPPPIQAENAEMERVLKELMAGRTQEEQQQIAVSQKQYEIGLAYFNKGDFERAKVSLQEAVRVWPENIVARKLLSQTLDVIVGRPGGVVRSVEDQAVRDAIVGTEQAQLEITMHVIHGQRYLGAAMYPSALKEFENAEFKILHLPYEVKAMNEILPKVRDGLARSKAGIRD